MEHKYQVSNSVEAFKFIEKQFRQLGYMEDNRMMIHDYLHFMLIDLLQKNAEVFITEETIRDNSTIQRLLKNTTPDFVIKSKDKRRTVIVDIYVGDKELNSIKSKYRGCDLFADLKIVTPHNFQAELKDLLLQSDLDYLYKNFQLFLAEYHYWVACLKLKKILFNDTENIVLTALPVPSDSEAHDRDVLDFVLALEGLSNSVHQARI